MNCVETNTWNPSLDSVAKSEFLAYFSPTNSDFVVFGDISVDSPEVGFKNLRCYILTTHSLNFEHEN